MSIIDNCYMCNNYPGIIDLPEINQKICGLCDLEFRVTILKLHDWIYHPPRNRIRVINVFDDGNQKYENEPNKSLKLSSFPPSL